MMYVYFFEARLTLRSPSERAQSLGKRSELAGTCFDGNRLLTALMLPFLGRDAGWARDERGSKQAPDEGPTPNGRCKPNHFKAECMQI